MRILSIITGEYGKRHVANLLKHKPESWEIETWQAPTILPPVIDYPEDYLPESFPPADLILSFAENKGVAELLPDIAKMCGARGVVVAIDDAVWLPLGLARQLHEWLGRMDVALATPKPLCTLTTHDYEVARRKRQSYQSEVISEFARYFGQPDLKIEVDPETRTIRSAEVNVDAVCGCARHVAERIIGMSADEVEDRAGLLHHHFPCLASMVKLDDYNHDTLMHESGHMLQDNIGEQVREYKRVQYIEPGERSDHA